MSVFTTVTLDCDGYDEARAPGVRLCMARFEWPDDYSGPKTGPALRGLAKAQGWTRMPSPAGRRFDRDYCPDCKPQEG